MKTNKKTGALELNKQTVKNLTVSSGLRAGCDAGCSNDQSGCTCNSGSSDVKGGKRII
jgi:hypothetical protein